MVYLIKFLYVWLLPPGIFILLCGLVAWEWRKNKKLNRCAIGLGLLIWIVSMSFVSDNAIGFLEAKHAVPDQVTGDVVVLLGGGIVVGNADVDGRDTFSGSMANRTITAIRLARKHGLPLLYSGGKMFADDGDQGELVKRYAVSLGMEPERIFIEGNSLNTTQSVRLMVPLMQREGWKRPIVVTSAYHMERSVQIFDRAGIPTQPWPCDFRRSIGRRLNYGSFLPSASAVENAAIFLREVLGLLSLKTAYVNW